MPAPLLLAASGGGGYDLRGVLFIGPVIVAAVTLMKLHRTGGAFDA